MNLCFDLPPILSTKSSSFVCSSKCGSWVSPIGGYHIVSGKSSKGRTHSLACL